MKKFFAYLFSILCPFTTSAAIPFSMTQEEVDKNTPSGWTEVQLPADLPAFTDANTFVITDAPYNASSASDDNTAAIQAALDAAATVGGGMVVIPEGTYLSGCLTMGSKTVLHICENATLKMLPIGSFATDDNGFHKMTAPFITGKSGASDIVIEGESRTSSIIDGQGAPWWDEVEDAKEAKKSTTRQAMIRFWQGSRYLFRNFRIQNAPNTNITIGRNGTGSHATAHNINIKNPSSEAEDPSHNTDGFPIWTQYVNIYDCEIDTGDDNIVCDENAQYVHVWNCDLKEGHGASFGSYTTNMHDIIYEDLTLTGTDSGFRLKSNNDRSGDVYNIIFRNVTMTNVANPISITCWYDSLPASPEYIDSHPHDSTSLTPAFRDILIQNVTASGDTQYKQGSSNPDKDRKYFGIFIYGRPESYVRNVTFDKVNLTHSKGLKLNFCDGIKFKDCSITVSNNNKTEKNGASTEEELPDLLIEQKYKGSYLWNNHVTLNKAILSWQLGEGGTDATAANSITGAAGSEAEGFTIVITGNTTKNWSNGNGFITYNSTSYKTLKNSNGAQNTVTLPAGQYAHKVEFYATSNADSSGKLSEFNGASCNDEVTSLKNYINPTYITKEFATGVNSFTFTFGTKQVCFIAIITYNDMQVLPEPDPEPEPEPEGRSFTDFKIDFRDNPASIILPTTGILPDGVTVSGTSYNGGQHGVQGGTVTVPVDGPVKFTIGACQYSNGLINVQKNGENFTTIDNKKACGETKPSYNQNVTWTYNSEEAATLTFVFGSTYVPYFFAEACEYVPQVTVSYYDVDGKTLIGSEAVDGSSALVYLFNASNVTIPYGKTFRGWYDGTTTDAAKVPEGTILTEDINLYAQVRDIEVAEVGKVFEYDFRQPTFDPDEHELLTVSGGSYNGSQHGWAFGNGNSLSIEVAGNALLVVGVCRYSATTATDVKDAAGNKVGELNTVNNTTVDGSEQTIRYSGEATILTFYFTATNYIHKIKVYNVASLPEKNSAGYYEIAPGDAAAFLLTLEMAEAGDKIFLPNGTYDLGERVLTPVNVSNLSIIGQSMEGTIIKNAPDYHTESINNTATLLISNSADNTYLQDLTLKNELDYYTAIETINNGRAIALEDDGTHTISKNVRLLSYQDTYYSHHAGAQNYFEDCEIHGTVDYICGNGTVYFKNNLLYNEQRYRNSRNGSDAITAHNGSSTDNGYVFEGCTIKSECDVVSLSRAWNDHPQVIFLNSLVDYSAGEFSFSDSQGKIQRWTRELMNANAWPVFGEYNTHLENGTVLTPANNVVTFVDNKSGGATQDIETVLTAEQAADYSYANAFNGSWDPAAEAAQTTADPKAVDDEAAYLVEDGKGAFVALVKGSALSAYAGNYIRKANNRGGFGAKVLYSFDPTGVETVQGNDVRCTKVLRNGQLIVVRDGVEYNILGTIIK